jgi:hypothetical protein
MPKLWNCGLHAPAQRYRHRRLPHLALDSAQACNIHTGRYVCSQTPKSKEEEVTRSGAHAGDPAAGGISGGLPMGFPGCGPRHHPCHHRSHQRSTLLSLRQQGSLGVCHRRRSHRSVYPTQMAASFAQWRGPDRYFDPHCSGNIRSTTRMSVATVP